MNQPVQQRSRQLVPRPLRPPARILIGLSALTVGILGILVAHGTQPTALDSAVANLVVPQFGPDGFGGGFGLARQLGSLLRPFGKLGGPAPIVLMTAVLCYCCAAMRRYRGAVLLAGGVIVASGLTEFVLKPLIHRTYTGSLSFPSGHATAAFALATGIIVLLADPPESRMPRSMRAVLAVLACGVAGATALGLVAEQIHYFTDTIGGAAVGIGVTLSTALLLDQLAARRARAAGPAPVPAEPARLA